MLPNQARHGLSFKAPDELAVFNDERRQKWDAAMAKVSDWQLDDAVMLFEYLARDDTYDEAAWYNLGLAYAWSGENAKAIEAFDHYVQHESDFNTAADAWDVCEVLRLGVGAEEYSDHLFHIAIYETPDVQAALERLKDCGNILVTMRQESGPPVLRWMDRDIPPDDAPIPLFGRAPRCSREFGSFPISFTSWRVSADNLRETRTKLELLMAETARLRGTITEPADPQSIDSEPVMVYQKASDPKEHAEKMTREVNVTSKTSGFTGRCGPSPAWHPSMRCTASITKEGRGNHSLSRRRNFERYQLPYWFDRLRNKLGLESLVPKDHSEPSGRLYCGLFGRTAYAAVPAALSDEDLHKAYRTALSLDAQRTALHFAEEMVKRDSLADKADMIGVFRRLVLAALEDDDADAAQELVHSAMRYDEKHYGGANRSTAPSCCKRCLTLPRVSRRLHPISTVSTLKRIPAI